MYLWSPLKLTISWSFPYNGTLYTFMNDSLFLCSLPEPNVVVTIALFRLRMSNMCLAVWSCVFCHYHPTLYACAFAHMHVHDRKITFSHKTYVHTRYRYACTWQKENILSWNVRSYHIDLIPSSTNAVWQFLRNSS